MFEAAVSGSRTDQIEGVEVVIRPTLTAAAVDVLEANGYLLGTPVHSVLDTLARRCVLTCGNTVQFAREARVSASCCRSRASG